MKRIFPVLLLFTFTTYGCKPTYPRAKVSESIIELCKKEYNTEVKVTFSGKTLGVYMPLDDLLQGYSEPSEETYKKLGNVLQVLSRVALSTDADFEFITLVAKDSKISGFELVLTRYVEDIKRFMVGDISRGEYIKRMLLETRFDPTLLLSELIGKEGRENLKKEEFSIEEVRFPDFIAKQISRRIEDRFNEDKRLKKNFKVVAINGEFIPKVSHMEGGIFKFSLNIVSKLETTRSLAEWGTTPAGDLFSLVWRAARNALKNFSKKREKKFKKEDVLPISLETVKSVLQRYNFRDFAGIEILDKNTGKSLIVDNKGLNW